jgi:hypothetical protein
VSPTTGRERVVHTPVTPSRTFVGEFADARFGGLSLLGLERAGGFAQPERFDAFDSGKTSR